MSERTVPASVAQRVIIKFLAKEGVPPSDICVRLQAQFGNECLSQTRVINCAKPYMKRNTDDPQAQRSTTPDSTVKIDD